MFLLSGMGVTDPERECPPSQANADADALRGRFSLVDLEDLDEPAGEIGGGGGDEDEVERDGSSSGGTRSRMNSGKLSIVSGSLGRRGLNIAS